MLNICINKYLFCLINVNIAFRKIGNQVKFFYVCAMNNYRINKKYNYLKYIKYEQLNKYGK